MTVAGVGKATVENLLRVARSEAAAPTAFAALHTGASAPEIVAVPDAWSSGGLSGDDLAEVVRRAAADPEFPVARVFVRSVPIGSGLTLAVAPLRGGGEGDMIGLVAEPDRRFEPAQLEVLERLAERLFRHLEVVRQLHGSVRRDPGRRETRHAATAGEDEALRAGATAGADTAEAAAENAAEAAEAAAEAVTGTAEPAREASSTPRRSFVQAVAASRPSTLRFPHPGEGEGGAAPDDRRHAHPDLWWAEPDPLTELPSLAQFFSRAGRMLALEGRPGGAGGAVTLVVVEVPDEHTTAAAARVLTRELRFTDPVARVDRCVLAAALAIFPSASAAAVEQRLSTAVRAALGRSHGVRTAHVVAEAGDRRDVDELLREAIGLLQRL